MHRFKKLDTVALLIKIPEYALVPGQVGTILDHLEKGVYEVEFADKLGQTLASIAVKAKNLMLLHYETVK
ncbi:MAG: DUF4926 domain-containing protein [Cyclobacteriaceae bacterium]